MLDMCKSKALQLKAKAEGINLAPFGRWLPATALLVIAGCSWFDEEPTPPSPSEQAQAPSSTATPAPGEGETMNGEQPTVPDINSVPNEAPTPSIVNLDQAQEGLGSDSGNSQHTDETLTMPTQSAARPEPPVAEGPATAQADLQPQAPEQSDTTTVTTPEPATPSPVVDAPTPPPTPAPAPTTQVAQVGTPQAGSQPFEPSGPLHLEPGSLSRDGGTASAPTGPTTTAPSGIAAMPLAGSSDAPMTPAPSGDGVSVDYSVLNGLQASAPTTYQQPMMGGVAPVRGYAPSGSIAGVGQAVGYVYFGNGSSRLSAADRQVLQQVAQLQQIQGGVLRIIGHASARTGNMEALEQQQVNHEMSMQRATAVARALVEYGVQPILVQVAAAGDDQTLYAESTPAGEAGNRRAEVYLSQN
ncbi:OmpA family protein [Dongia sp.]|uniref:OmpA family protein n=1 Tax=Dongia sp. TaxID=1977262 RepID=UPI0037536DFA